MSLLVIGGIVACCKLVFFKSSDKSSHGGDIDVTEAIPMHQPQAQKIYVQVCAINESANLARVLCSVENIS